jgi:hypothetical protein
MAVVDMLEVQNNEVDRIGIEVSSVASRLKQLRSTAGQEEFNRFASPKKIKISKKYKTVKCKTSSSSHQKST